MKIESADKIKGILINSCGKFLFRVYGKNGEFKDYDIAHNDLSITINDSDAYFYDDEKLDHSPETLGYKK